MPDSKDIYLVRIYYKGQLGAFKSRPVLILNILDNGWVTIAEITSVPPKKPPSHYDEFKEPIIRWPVYGLANPSFIKCKNIHNIETSRRLVRKNEIYFVFANKPFIMRLLRLSS